MISNIYKISAEKMIGLILLLTSLFFLFLSLKLPEGTWDILGASFFPKLCSIVMICLSILMILKKQKEASGKVINSVKGVAVVCFTCLLLLLYVILFEIVGFSIITFLLSFSLSFILSAKTKGNVFSSVISSFVLTIVLYFVFEKVLYTVFPPGLLIYIKIPF